MDYETEGRTKRRNCMKIGVSGLCALAVVLVIAAESTGPSALTLQPSQSAPMVRAPRVALPQTEQLAEIRAVMHGCNEAWEEVGDIPGSALGRVAARSVVAHAAQVCGDSGIKLRELRRGHESEPLGDIIQFCQATVEKRRIASESIAALFDTGARRSAVEKARVDIVDAARAAMACDGALG